MPKPQKITAVEELVGDLRESKAALLSSFQGLKVAEMTELRRALAPTQTQFKVVKNTLAQRAATEAGMESLLPLLEGSTAIAFIRGDVVAAAKGLDEVAKKYPALVLKGGIMDGAVMNAEKAQSLTTIKPREVLLAGLAGAILSPVAAVAGMLAAPVRTIGYALAAYRDKLAEGAPPAAAPTAPEPSAPAEPPAEEVAAAAAAE